MPIKIFHSNSISEMEMEYARWESATVEAFNKMPVFTVNGRKSDLVVMQQQFNVIQNWTGIGKELEPGNFWYTLVVQHNCPYEIQRSIEDGI